MIGGKGGISSLLCPVFEGVFPCGEKVGVNGKLDERVR